MQKEDINLLIYEVVELLVNSKYEELYANDKNQRVPADELKGAIESYRGHLTMPPNEAIDKYEIYTIEKDKEYVIEYELWFDNVQSDLTLTLNVERDEDNVVHYSIEDVHVL